jgi:hypothetical protein
LEGGGGDGAQIISRCRASRLLARHAAGKSKGPEKVTSVISAPVMSALELVGRRWKLIAGWRARPGRRDARARGSAGNEPGVERNSAVAVRNVFVVERNGAVFARNAMVAARNTSIAARNTSIAARNASVAARKARRPPCGNAGGKRLRSQVIRRPLSRTAALLVKSNRRSC